MNEDQIDVRKIVGNNHFRFCNFFDQESRDFEDKISNSRLRFHTLIDDSGMTREVEWPNISFWQSYKYLSNLDQSYEKFYVLQLHNTFNNHYYQIALRLEISRISFFQFGEIQKWIVALSDESVEDQKNLIRELILLLKTHTIVSSLRIQVYMPGDFAIKLVTDLLQSVSFNPVQERSYSKTRLFDLRDSTDNILKKFSSNGRARLKIKEKDSCRIVLNEIREINSIPHLQKALSDSYSRTLGKGEGDYNFKPLIKCANDFENEVLIFGFYFKELLNVPKAFITGVKHLNVTEFSVGGSVSEGELRQYPFNHLLMWNLALKAKKYGSQFIDMGGIAREENHPNMAGINKFKRYFPGFELTVGNEMAINLRPNRIQVYSLIKKLIALINI